MLTKIIIRNFKMFEDVTIPLGNGFVFIGPNNGGKTSALQALALWQTGLQKWGERYASRDADKRPAKRPGVTVNRLDLIPVPVSEADLIWRNRKVRKGSNENIRIDLIVEGVNKGKEWQCGLEFDYANPEAFFCRPLRTDDDVSNRMPIPDQALDIKIAFLPPMSGLATEEALIQEGRISVLLGQGQTAEVLRNLCYRVYVDENKEKWQSLKKYMEKLFGIALAEPKFLSSRGTVTMSYTEVGKEKTKLDLSSSGRGMQQVLLLLANLYDNASNTVFLLDEPDAHLEILRQGQVYNLINEVAEQHNSQIISASHSEILLNEAARNQSAVAFVSAYRRSPHVLAEGKIREVLAALAEIGFEYYHDAEQKGWILYLEGPTDLSILQAFASKMEHPAGDYLKAPLVKYIGNNRKEAHKHFSCLKEAKSDLTGFLLLDRTNKHSDRIGNLTEHAWKKYEIENYLCSREAIIAYITDGIQDDLVGYTEVAELEEKMNAEIKELEDAYEKTQQPAPFSDGIKASDKFLVLLFENFAKSMGQPASTALQKRDFYKLVKYMPLEQIDDEVKTVLDLIVKTAEVEKQITDDAPPP